MQKHTKLRFGVVAAVAMAALAFGTVSPAYADPTGSKDLNGSGSDTTQDVMSGVASAVPALGNWDAVPAGSSVTVDGVTFSRPIGSTAGIRALSSSIRGIAYVGTTLPVGTLDYARASALRSDTGTQLTYIPFARDAVSIGMNAASDFPKDVALGSAGQASNLFTLRNIYLGTVTSFIDGAGNSITIRPLLPQLNSGTRQYWVSVLGTTEAALTAGGQATDLGNTVQEHDGTFLTGDGDIVPFSVGQWLAQSNNGSLPTNVVERRGQVILGSIDTVKPIIYDGSVIATNPDFLPSRIVYNVVETRALTTATPSASDLAVRAAFSGPTSSVCAATVQIKQYGFATIGSLCGDITTQRGYVN
jgi:ABC-type phosphate transport system substrate-binding protein